MFVTDMSFTNHITRNWNADYYNSQPQDISTQLTCRRFSTSVQIHQKPTSVSDTNLPPDLGKVNHVACDTVQLRDTEKNEGVDSSC
jgi:hypothetical protein